MALGFYFDQNACIGCRACMVACKDVKELPVGVAFRRVFSFETGKYPDASAYHYSMGCNHCSSPACVAVCSTGAMHIGEDGTVQHDDEICIGCRSCTQACPYEVPQYREGLTIVQKCDSCVERRNAGKNPACVDACPMRALHFGDLDELSTQFGSELVKELPFLPTSDTTNPNVLIDAKPVALAEEYRKTLL